MVKKIYSKTFKIKVVEEALKEEFKDKHFLIANKYKIRESTVDRWVKTYLEHGTKGLAKNASLFIQSSKLTENMKDRRIKELEEENEILKKAAAFLAKVNRD